MSDERKPGQRAGLSSEQIMNSAHELLLEKGGEKFSMRALAQRLGVAPNALYSYVPNKDHLLDQLLDALLGCVGAPGPEVDDPVKAILAIMTDTYDVLTNHPAYVPVYLLRQGARGRNATRLGELMDACFTRAGIPREEIPDARRVLIIHVIGFAAFSTTAPNEDRPITAEGARRTFRMSLDWMLEGILRSAHERLD